MAGKSNVHRVTIYFFKRKNVFSKIPQKRGAAFRTAGAGGIFFDS